MHTSSTITCNYGMPFNCPFPSKVYLRTPPTSPPARRQNQLDIPPWSCGRRDDVIGYFDGRSSHLSRDAVCVI